MHGRENRTQATLPHLASPYKGEVITNARTTRPATTTTNGATRSRGGIPHAPERSTTQSHSNAPFFQTYQNPTTRMAMKTPISMRPNRPNL